MYNYNIFTLLLVPDPTVVIQPNAAYAAAPFTGVFTCSVKGYGKMNIRWYKGDNDFSAQTLPKKCRVSIDNSTEITISTLEIPNPTSEDAGIYTCYVDWTSTNKAFKERATLYISGMLFI